MDFFQVVRSRRSTRAFHADPVEPEKLQAILEAANRAPSAGNLQGYDMRVVTRRFCLEQLARASLDQGFIAQAPLAVVFSALPRRSSRKYGARGASLYSIQDATIACAYAQLAATALGLASVWVGAFEDDAVRRAVDAGPEVVPVAILPIGYAGEEPEATARRSLEEIVYRIG